MVLSGMDIFMDEIGRRAKGSIKLPSMPRNGKIKKMYGRTKADVMIKVDGDDKKLEKVPVLGENNKYELEVTGENVSYTHKKESNLKKNDKVMLAYMGGDFSDAVIVGKK
jgi:hypothetical protein